MAERKQEDAQNSHDLAKKTMDEFLDKLGAYQDSHEQIILQSVFRT